MHRRAAGLAAARQRLFVELGDRAGITVFPSGANFLLFRIEGGRPDDSGHGVWEAMVRHGVLVRDFSRWPRVEGCLRVTVGTPAENDAFLAALDAALEEVQG
jgi:histidinol-phosphate aminotransferase